MPKVKKVIDIKGLSISRNKPMRNQTTMLTYVNAAGLLPPLLTQGKVSSFMENSLPNVSDSQVFQERLHK